MESGSESTIKRRPGVGALLAGVLVLGAAGYVACTSNPQGEPGSCVTSADCIAGDTCVLGQCQAPDENNDGGTDAGDDAGQQPTGGYCSSCSTDSDCGSGNYCVQGVCGVTCETAADCPAGAGCYTLSNGAKNCFPTSGSCEDVQSDAGQPEVDAGQPEVDAGHVEEDAGHPEQDAGQHEPDAGQMTHDAGTTVTDAGVCSPDTWANYFDNWFTTTCFSCHQHSGENESWVKSNSSTIISYVKSGQMPQGTTLPNKAEDAALIQTWVNCGYP